MEERTMLTVEELRSLWGISRATAYALVNSEDFPKVHIGRRIIIPKNQLDGWLKNHTEGVAIAQ